AVAAFAAATVAADAATDGYPVRARMLLLCCDLLDSFSDDDTFLDLVLSVLSEPARFEVGTALDKANVQSAQNTAQFGAASSDPGVPPVLPPRRYPPTGVEIRAVLQESAAVGKVLDILPMLRRMLVRQTRELKAARQVNAYDRWLKRQLAFLDLDRTDRAILGLLYCQMLWGPLENFVAKNILLERKQVLSAATKISVGDLSRRISRQGRLVATGVVDVEHVHRSWGMELQASVMTLLSGNVDTDFADSFCFRDHRPVFDLASFNLSEDATAIVNDLLRAPLPRSLLLHGEPGMGKTEFARAAAKANGLVAYFLKPPEDGQDIGDRRIHLQAAANCVPPKNGVLIVDEADSLLNTGFSLFSARKTLDKAWLNHFLDHSRIKILWITNQVDNIDPSLLRRFAYTVKFRNFTAAQRESVWRHVRRGGRLQALFTNAYIRELAARYNVSAGGIAAAADAVRAIAAVRGRRPPGPTVLARLRQTVENLLATHQDITGRRAPALAQLTRRYDLAALNLDVDPARLIDAIRTFTRRRTDLPRGDGESLNVLFWGPPGTGKTEFAKYLAAECGLPLIARRASDLLDPYLGITERKIKGAFEEAGEEPAILFLDEADSLFTERSDASRSWEISQTNELLVQMENFRGVLVCCTNLRERLDRAATRRFHWKVQFRPLADQAKVDLVQRYFQLGPAALNGGLGRRLRSIHDLTAGDVRAVWNKWRFAAANELTPERIVEELEREATYRSGSGERRIGF
ncbi:MAG: AAA family ATPase, partial [Planctomycetota bacterium]